MSDLKWVVDDGLIRQQDMIDCLAADLDVPSRLWVAVGVHDAEGYAESVAYCHPSNARLIAAAPAMYDALCSVVSEYDNDPANDGETAYSWIREAREALRQARGLPDLSEFIGKTIDGKLIDEIARKFTEALQPDDRRQAVVYGYSATGHPDAFIITERA